MTALFRHQELKILTVRRLTLEKVGVTEKAHARLAHLITFSHQHFGFKFIVLAKYFVVVTFDYF